MKKKGRKKTFPRKKRKAFRTEGILSCATSGKCGFVASEQKKCDIHIKREYFGGANHGDRVLVSFSESFHGKNPEGRILKVLERSTKPQTAVVIAEFEWGYSAKADDARFYPIISVPHCNAKIKLGDRIAVLPKDFDSFGDINAELICNFGSSDSIKSRIDAIVFSHEIQTDFSDAVISESEKLNAKISDSEISARLDLRKEKIITIDGDNSKDFDDAVSIRKLPNGYKLGVHIADVSHYVKEGTPLDLTAFERGTSIYLPDRVYPMLPHHLSDNICSLLPNEDRLAVSVIMNISDDGEIKSYKIAKSVICSVHRMTYSNVDKILAGDPTLKKKYSDILLALSHMDKLADILSAKRKKRGAIDFNISESSVVLTEDGKIGDVVPCKRLKSHQIIEEFMLAANETVALYASSRKLPIVYRSHAAPDSEKLKALSLFLQSFGISLPETEDISSKALADILESTNSLPTHSIIGKNMLRAMMKAEYTPENEGHFGLSSEFYCHFTSPIRRYPDLFTHRVLSNALSGEKLPKRSFEVSTSSTEKEQVAEDCERDTDKLLAVLYMAEHIGEEYSATISALTDFGIYAELENCIEGMIPLETVGGDYYIYNERNACTVGKRSGKKFRLGDRLDIVVVRADPNLLRIDFMLKKDYCAKEEKNGI